MKSYNLLRQYAWLLDTILKNGPISLEDINKRWIRTAMSGGVDLNRHTFIRYKNAIEETFGINIDCDRKTNRYFISNPRALRDDSVQQWMLSTLTVSNIISESLSIQDNILLENIPIEGQQLATIVDAMTQKRCISFHYQKYGDIESKERIVIPCCIKLFRQRWYVIDYDSQRAAHPYKAFAFDHISRLKLTDQPFELPAEFNAKDIFSHSFGIFIGDVETPQRIVIRAFGNERFYMRDLPLHHSQEVLKEGTDYTDYKYFIRPSTDFIIELLSKGDHIEVLSPESLRSRIREEHLKAAKRYEK